MTSSRKKEIKSNRKNSPRLSENAPNKLESTLTAIEMPINARQPQNIIQKQVNQHMRTEVDNVL